MAGPKITDRTKETSTTTGTGTLTLAGAVSGFQSFSAVGNGNSCFYCIAHQSAAEWEVGIGTYTSSGTTLSRTTVLASSNSGSLVSFSAGTKDVFVTDPAAAAQITGLTALTSPADADELGIYDTTAGGLKKITRLNLLNVAAQSDMETATDTSKPVTPGRTQYHPGVAKAWVRFNGTGTVAIAASYNVASITDNGTGDYTVNFTTAFSSANYGYASGNFTNTGVAVYVTGRESSTATATGSCRIGTRSLSSILTDIAEVYAAFFGDQ